MYPEKPRSNWWFLLPIILGIIGGIIAFFVLRHDDPKKAKNCLCLSLVLTFSLIGGIISYFVLRRDDPKNAKIFLYIGIIIFAVGIAINLILGPQLMELEQGFGVNI